MPMPSGPSTVTPPPKNQDGSQSLAAVIEGTTPGVALSHPEQRFTEFPQRTLLEYGELPLAQLAHLACKEGQASTPIYRVHRWFARRLGTQFRGILAGLALGEDEADRFWNLFEGELSLQDILVVDTFVGGGTSVVEASRCGARVIGFDIDPVAAFITRFELAAATYSGIPEVVQTITTQVAEQLREYHLTNVEGHLEEVLHHFWVELATCRDCGHTFEAHPHYELAHDSAKKRRWVFCRACHQVHEVSLEETRFDCHCGQSTIISAGTLGKWSVVRCPECGHSEDLSTRGRASGQPPTWRLFAQEYLLKNGRRNTRHFKAASDADQERYASAVTQLAVVEAELGRLAPERPIPVDGRLDGRPLIHGFRTYRQLFNARQLLHLTRLGHQIRAVGDEAAKRLLAMAFSDHLTTNCMYTGYAFGYRRTSPMFSIHGYRHISRPVELNPWLLGTGRGTFPNAVRKLDKAIRFAKHPAIIAKTGERRAGTGRIGIAQGTVSTDPADILEGRTRAAVVCRSSAALAELGSGTVDLVLTDPPYLDNVNYSELSDFYLAWHQALGVAVAPYDDVNRPAPLLENLAVNRRNQEAIQRYETELTEIFRQCNRVLHEDGVCVFTYHHLSWKAWLALGTALARSGLRCTAVLPMRGEGQGGLHSKAGSIKWDAILVCRRGEITAQEGHLVVSWEKIQAARTQAARYLELLGRDGKIGFNQPDLLNLFRAHLAANATHGTVDDKHVLLAAALNLPLREAPALPAARPPSSNAVPDQASPVAVHPHRMQAAAEA